MRIVTLLMASLTLLVSVAATAAVDVEPGEYVVFYHHDVLGSPVTATNERTATEYDFGGGRSAGVEVFALLKFLADRILSINHFW